MKSLLVKELDLDVHTQNYVHNAQDSYDQPKLEITPKIRNEYQHPVLPLIIDVNLNKSKVSIGKERIEGYLKFREVSTQSQMVVQQVFLAIVQQEGQPINSNYQSSQTLAPVQRTLKLFEVVDGCPVKDEVVPFCIPIKGIGKITPSIQNVYNKFSVKYFYKLVIKEVEGDQTREVESCLYEITLIK